MPKRKTKDKSESGIKAKTIFQHLDGLTKDKVAWDQLSDMDKKSFTVYLINRWLSMNPDLIELVNYFQQYTIGQLKPRDTYKLYYDFLPKSKLPFNKYIKGKKSGNHNQELVAYVKNYFGVSSKEASEYIDLYLMTDDRKQDLIGILRKHGITDKQITKLLNSK